MNMEQSTTQESGIADVNVTMSFSRKPTFAFLSLVALTAALGMVTLIGLTSLNEAVT